MRGLALVHPTVVGQLQPYIVTFWYGHRDDPDLPAVIRDYVWRPKFAPGAAGRGGGSNVDILVLDADGRPARTFSALPPMGPGRPWSAESVSRHYTRELGEAQQALGATAGGAARVDAAPLPVRLPTLASGRGVRVFVRLDDPGMRAYSAPIVEAAPVADATWRALAFPATPRAIAAGALREFLDQVYPSGVMERTDPDTKEVYAIAEVKGDLTLAPAGADARQRFAVLRGEVTFLDAGGDGFAYGGTLELLLSYPPADPTPTGLCGSFQGIYPRFDRAHGVERKFPLIAAFESLPRE